MKIFIFIISLFFAQPCFSEGSISFKENSIYINQQNIKASQLLENIEAKTSITFTFDADALNYLISINKEFHSLEAAINNILRHYNRVLIYDNKGKLASVRVLNVKNFTVNNQSSPSTESTKNKYRTSPITQSINKNALDNTIPIHYSNGILMSEEDPEEVISVDEDPDEVISVDEDPDDVISIDEDPDDVISAD